MKIWTIKYILLFCGSVFLFAQDPPDIEWKQIQTEHFQIIFPEEIGQEANRVANTLESFNKPLSKTLSVLHPPIPILLSNRGAVSNGYVRLFPRMSEWFSVPATSKFSGTMEWYNLLALHEGRHMVQYASLNTENAYFAGLMFGDIGKLFYSNFVPPWFYEGDAVLTETVLSKSGRGRMPYFDRDIRALLLDNIHYNYRKALFGSYKDYYPSHYQLGYLMTTHVRRNYDSSAWKNILHRTMTWPFSTHLLFPFSKSMKMVTNRNAKEIYRDTMDELSEIWQKQITNLELTPSEIISPQKHKIRTNYNNPGENKKGEIFAIKCGPADQAEIVRITQDDAIPISPVSETMNRLGININGNKAVGTEIHVDKRWDKLSWANIVVYNLESGERKQITQNTRYYNPAISNCGNLIATVEFTETRKCYLVILNGNNGEIICKNQSPNLGTILFPSWAKSGKKIVFTSHKYNGKGLYVFNIDTGIFDIIRSESEEDILRPVFWKDYILYESPYSGIDNIYAVNSKSGKTFQITSKKLGAYNPTISYDDQYLIFNNFTRLGMVVEKMKLDRTLWKPMNDIAVNPTEYFKPVIEQEQGKSICKQDLISQKQYTVSDYSGLERYSNIHSWLLSSEINEFGVNIISSNILNTMQYICSAGLNINEKTSHLGGSILYKALYPILTLQTSFGGRSNYKTADTTLVFGKNLPGDFWKETAVSLNARFPVFYKTAGIHRKRLTFSSEVEYINISEYKQRKRLNSAVIEVKKPNKNGTALPISFALDFQTQTEGSARDLVLGAQKAYIKLSRVAGSQGIKGGQLYFKISRSLKAPFKHHGLILEYEYEYNNSRGYKFISNIITPRGYIHYLHRHINKISAQYKFPVAYPDWDILGAMYLKRFYATFFSDWMKGAGDFDKTYFSTGVAFTFESAGFFEIPFNVPMSLIFYYLPTQRTPGIAFGLEF